MLHEASDIPTSTPDPFDGGCPADTENLPRSEFDLRAEVNRMTHECIDLATKNTDLSAENKRLVKKNQLLLKAIADISRELDDLVHRCGLIASGATAN